MKSTLSITNLNVSDVGKALIDRLSIIYPKGCDGYNFHVELPEDDIRVKKILEELSLAGLHQEPTGKWGKYLPGKEFSRFPVAIYENSDFNQARWFSWFPANLIPRVDEENSDTQDPPIRLLSSLQSLDSDFFSTNFDRIIVTSRGRRTIDDGEIIGMQYIPAYIVNDYALLEKYRNSISNGGTIGSGAAHLWELRPSSFMPPMIPAVYRHQFGEEIRVTRNPIAGDRRMAYKKQDLDRLGVTDVARPEQMTAEGSMHKDCLVTSRRFFELMQRQSWFVLDDWLPVREE